MEGGVCLDLRGIAGGSKVEGGRRELKHLGMLLIYGRIFFYFVKEGIMNSEDMMLSNKDLGF